jgi:DNA-binding NtrC family response regulator
MPQRIAIVDDELIVCRRLGQSLSKEGYEVETFPQGQAFLERFKQLAFDLVFLDLVLPDANGLDLLVKIKSLNQETEVILITGHGSIDTAMEAVRHGAFHYATKPLKLKEISHLAHTALETIALRRENARLREAIDGDDGLNRIVGRSPAMQQVFSMIRKVAPVDCNVLIEGGSGTGKALVAQAIHKNSPRRDRPFLFFNCGGFTEELISSELFGYEKGAFTGATATKIGLLESADSGTVFLDEIGEMPPSMQVKLLHVIQEKKILRVGGLRPLDLDIRILAATNKELKQEVETGQFREDLYYRLNVVTLRLPSLTERAEDIPLLTWHFVQKYSQAFNKPITDIHPQAMQILTCYSFPGNVRELENIIERAVALSDSKQIRIQDLPPDLQRLELNTLEGEGLIPLLELEKRYILKVLEKTNYNKGLTAQILGIPRTTLWRKLKAFGLD